MHPPRAPPTSVGRCPTATSKTEADRRMCAEPSYYPKMPKSLPADFRPFASLITRGAAYNLASADGSAMAF